jgi:LPXTG-motif cell wall-anchored protein
MRDEKMVRTNEGGSVLGFVVVGVVLVGLLLGGAYFLSHQRNTQSTGTQPVPAPAEKKTDDGNRKSDDTKSRNQESDKDKSQASPQQEQQASSNELPQTGPADTALSMVAVGLLSAAVFSYLRSRRQIRLFDLR